MKAAIISIGDELLIGQTVNTNASFIGEQLTQIGIDVRIILTIADERLDIVEALRQCQDQYDVVMITGGLGPTKDDITKKVFADYFHVPLVENEGVLANIYAFFKTYQREVQEVNRLQAMVPQGCRVIMNEKGTAPGMWMQKGKTVYVSMPGVPGEMKHLVGDKLVPIFKKEFSLPSIYSSYILTQGVGESFIAEQIEDLENDLPTHIKLAYLPSRGMVKLRLTGKSKSSMAELIEEVAYHALLIQTRIEEDVYGTGNEKLSEVVGEKLLAIGAKVAVAESLSGGGVLKNLTSISGASEYVLGGIVAYDEKVKIQELNVSASDINKYGVVSEQVAVQMAEGVKRKLKADYGIGTTGFAGPTGGDGNNPIGTVYIAVSGPNETVARKFNMGSDRAGVVQRTILSAMNLLRMQVGK